MYKRQAKENAERNGLSNCEFIAGDVFEAVSYTHLDVYKRQEYLCIKDGEEKGFTASEFKTAQKQGWDCLLYTSRCV